MQTTYYVAIFSGAIFAILFFWLWIRFFEPKRR
jgi:hypothetical protein